MASIYDIAKATGVSSATVSLILNDRGDDLRIAKKTQQRVREAAREMGYVPNINARRLLTRDLDNIPEIGLFWGPSQHATFLNTMIGKLMEMKNKKDIRDINITVYPFENGSIDKFRKVLEGNLVHGIVIPLSDDRDIAFLKQLELKVPLITIYRDSGQYYLVNVDNYRNGRTACEIFYGLGIRRVGIVEKAYRSEPSAVRMKGFRDTCERLGMEIVFEAADNPDPVEFHSGYGNYRYGRRVAESVADREIRPQGIFTQDDDTARGLVAGLEKRGVRVPEEIAVICYGFNSNENREEKRLTMITYPVDQMAEMIWSLMDRLIRHEEVDQRQFLCGSPVYFGRSCPKPEGFLGDLDEG